MLSQIVQFGLISIVSYVGVTCYRGYLSKRRWDSADEVETAASKLDEVAVDQDDVRLLESEDPFVQPVGLFEPRWIVSTKAMECLSARSMRILFDRGNTRDRLHVGRYERTAMILPLPFIGLGMFGGVSVVYALAGTLGYYAIIYPQIERRLTFHLDNRMAAEHGAETYRAVLNECVECSERTRDGVSAYLFPTTEYRLKRLSD